MKLCIRKYMPIQLSRFSSMKRHEGTAELEIIWDIWRLQWVRSHLFGVTYSGISSLASFSLLVGSLGLCGWGEFCCWQLQQVTIHFFDLPNIRFANDRKDTSMIFCASRLISNVSLWPNLVRTFMSHRKIMLCLIVLDPCRGWTPGL